MAMKNTVLVNDGGGSGRKKEKEYPAAGSGAAPTQRDRLAAGLSDGRDALPKTLERIAVGDGLDRIAEGGAAGRAAGGGSYGGGGSDAAGGTYAAPRYDRTAPELFGDTDDPALVGEYRDALSALERLKEQAPSYDNAYDAQIRELYEQLAGRGPFRYDSRTDPLYQQYVQDYTRLGDMAMRDTIGRAAALTGGYGSTYAQSAGQQAYDAYLQRLADVLPETYGLALDAYRAEGEGLEEKLAAARSLEQSDYERYLDALSRHDRQLALAQADADERYERMTRAEQKNYDRRLDRYGMQKDAYSRLLGLLSAGYRPSKEEYNAAGLSEAQGEALRAAYAPREEAPRTVYVRGEGTSKSGKAAKNTEKKAESTVKDTAAAVNRAVNNLLTKYF